LTALLGSAGTTFLDFMGRRRVRLVPGGPIRWSWLDCQSGPRRTPGAGPVGSKGFPARGGRMERSSRVFI